MPIGAGVVEHLVYGSPATHRYTQDSPVLADVWTAYGKEPEKTQDLLLTPRFGSSAGRVSVELRQRLRAARPDGPPPRVAYNDVYVAASVHYRELIHLVLPMTRWWPWLWSDIERIRTGHQPDDGEVLRPDGLLRDPKIQGHLFQALTAMRRELLGHEDGSSDVIDEEAGDEDGSSGSRAEEDEHDENAAWTAEMVENAKEMYSSIAALPGDLPWFVQVAGTVGWLYEGPGASRRRINELSDLPKPATLIRVVTNLLADDLVTAGQPDDRLDDTWVWQVNLNRKAETAVYDSRLAMKADAAERLFEIDTGKIAWAIIDSGIDARHLAFLDPCEHERDGDECPEGDDGEPDNTHDWWERTRVRATYDFTRIEWLLDPLRLEMGDVPGWVVEVADKLRERAEYEGRDEDPLDDLITHLLRGRALDWAMLEPYLRVPMDPEDGTYESPLDGHGTHVAGILGADWTRDPMGKRHVKGICPNINLYDLRVIAPQASGSNDEFAVLAALQFVEWLNGQKDYYAVHGVNMSLSIRHEVANFACGRTPVCDQCDALTSTGVVVVAAAGNAGYLKYKTAAGPANADLTVEGYNTVSISDPGNAASVITVGSTHGSQPYAYGVSYFSSRGPTGDGRLKPDLVAPGEKIFSAHLQQGGKRLDGTSMAAPHVSGAAAMLLARYAELIGDPARVKRVLCDTATDLGREKYFQGAGMLDVLRALQSI